MYDHASGCQGGSALRNGMFEFALISAPVSFSSTLRSWCVIEADTGRRTETPSACEDYFATTVHFFWISPIPRYWRFWTNDDVFFSFFLRWIHSLAFHPGVWSATVMLIKILTKLPREWNRQRNSEKKNQQQMITGKNYQSNHRVSVSCGFPACFTFFLPAVRSLHAYTGVHHFPLSLPSSRTGTATAMWRQSVHSKKKSLGLVGHVLLSSTLRFDSESL